MVVVSSNSNLTSLSYVAGEVVDIQNGATLTANTSTSVFPGNTQCITQGKLLITNSSTTTPIVWTFNTNNHDFIFQSNGILEIAGQMIVIYTGNGAANQTINFSSIGGVAIDYPGYIEVETGNGTNVYRPWHILPGAGLLGTVVNQYLNFNNHGNGDLGNVCLFNETTKVLSFGNGTNGNVIPNGARVRFPNIHITSAVNDNTQANRSLLNLNPAGSATIQNCSFSNAFFLNISNAAILTINKAGFIGRPAIASVGALSINNFLSNIDGRSANNGHNISNCTGSTTVDRIYAIAQLNNTAVTISNLPNLTSIQTIEAFGVGRTGGLSSCTIVSLRNCTITDLRVAAHTLFFQNCENCTLEGYKFSDTPTGVTTTSNPGGAMFFLNSSGCVVNNASLLSPGAPPFFPFFSVDGTSRNSVIKNSTIDLVSHGFFMNFTGSNLTIYNNNISNGRASNIGGSQGLTLAAVRMLGNPTQSIQPIARCRYEFVQAASVSLTVPNYLDVGTFYTIVNSPTSTGNLVVGGFGEQSVQPIYDFVGVNGTDYYLDKNGKLFLVTGTAQVVIKSWYSIRSITSFQNIAPTITGTNTGTLTFQFRIANPKDTIATLPWQSLTAANLISALSGLTGYDNSVGFNMHIRITCTGADAARNINQIVMPTNNNSTFAPEVGTVAVGVSGAVEGSLVGVINNSNPSARTLLGTAVVNSAGTASVAVPYNFDGSTIPLLIRVRKPTHEPTELSAAFTGSALSFPVSQKAVTDITGAAIYGRGSAPNKALVGFTVASRKIITVGNGKVKGESLFDAIADFISSEAGILLDEAFRFNGTDGLLLNGWKFRRLNPTDSNAAIDIAVSVDGFLDESPDLETDLGTSYGSIDMRAQTVRSVFSASDAGLVATAVWEKAIADLTAPSTTGDQLKKALTLVQFLGLK